MEQKTDLYNSIKKAKSKDGSPRAGQNEKQEIEKRINGKPAGLVMGSQP